MSVIFELLIVFSLGIIGEIDCDFTFRYIETSGFGVWLQYLFDTGKVDHMGELISRLVDSSLYPAA